MSAGACVLIILVYRCSSHENHFLMWRQWRQLLREDSSLAASNYIDRFYAAFGTSGVPRSNLVHAQWGRRRKNR